MPTSPPKMERCHIKLFLCDKKSELKVAFFSSWNQKITNLELKRVVADVIFFFKTSHFYGRDTVVCQICCNFVKLRI